MNDRVSVNMSVNVADADAINGSAVMPGGVRVNMNVKESVMWQADGGVRAGQAGGVPWASVGCHAPQEPQAAHTGGRLA